MTRGAWTCWQTTTTTTRDGGGGGFQQQQRLWLETPRGGGDDANEKPCTDSERAQRWRLSLASLLFLSILLSDHLWFCAEAKLTRTTRDKFSSSSSSSSTSSSSSSSRDMMGAYPPPHPSSSSSRHHHHPPRTRAAAAPPGGGEDAFFILGNHSTKPQHSQWRRVDTCGGGVSDSKDCVTFGGDDDDADHLCEALSASSGVITGTGTPPPPPPPPVNTSALYLSFCNSYSLLDLFHGATSPDALNCSPDALLGGGGGGGGGDMTRCSLCVQAYRRYDQHAQEKYEDFELMTQKYETDAYSVRTCMEQCKVAYKPWLCAQYFPTVARGSCARRVPCSQLCLEVQQSCPFILPDNDDLIHGGSPSFICTGLLGERPLTPEHDAECCDVRWEAQTDRPSGGTLKKRTAPHPPCQPPHGGGATSGGSARLCLLALVLLHTAIAMSVSDCTATSWTGGGQGERGRPRRPRRRPLPATSDEEGGGG